MRKLDLNSFRLASSETARDINRRIVLNLVRQHQPISRASLARRSGVQRSTVSAMTEQLLAERWVVEGATGHLSRGRKPTFLHLNPDRDGIIGVDIQPGVTTLAVSSMDTRILAQDSIATGWGRSWRRPSSSIPSRMPGRSFYRAIRRRGRVCGGRLH